MMLTRRQLLIPALLQLATGYAAPCFAQLDIPDGPPAQTIEVVNAAVQSFRPNPTYGWIPGWGMTAEPEQVVKLIVTYPRQRALSRPWQANPPAQTCLSGRAWDFGGSAVHTNEPASRGWSRPERGDCDKGWPTPYGQEQNIVMRVGYDGAEPQIIGPAYEAHEIVLRYSGGHVVAIRHDVDFGTECESGMTGEVCLNPACERFMVCAAPWVFPNMPCGTCGVLGFDTTTIDWGLYQYTTINTVFDPEAWERPTVADTGVIVNPHTAAQGAGGPPASSRMSAQLVQRIAVSDSDYYPHGVLNRQYTSGLYTEVIDNLVIYRAGSYPNGNPRWAAEFRIRKWLLWSFSTQGLFDYLTAWFCCEPAAGLCDGAVGVETTDIFAFLTEWFEGSR